jgi:antitoxin component of MazEF toxin-antitoxin module
VSDLRVATVNSGRLRVPQQILDLLNLRDGDQVAFLRVDAGKDSFRIEFVPTRKLAVIDVRAK